MDFSVSVSLTFFLFFFGWKEMRKCERMDKGANLYWHSRVFSGLDFPRMLCGVFL